MSLNNVMVDLETLGTGPDAAILSIGAVLFSLDEPMEVGNSISLNVDVGDCVDHGMTIDDETARWWMRQNEPARSALCVAPTVLPLRRALTELAMFIPPNAKVWGNGAGFDNAILENAYRKAKLVIPWSYRNNMCYRTLKTIYADIPRPTGGVSHIAVEDAHAQILHLQEIWRKLKNADA